MKLEKKRLLQIRDMTRPFLGTFMFLSFLVLCSQGMGIVITYIFGGIIDAVGSNSDISNVIWLMAGALVVLGISNISSWLIARTQINNILTDMEIHFNRITLEKISTFSIGQITNQNSGYKQDVIKKGESAISEMANTLFMDAIPNIMRVLIAGVALCVLNLYVGIVAMMTLAGFILVSLIINNKSIPRIKSNRKLENKLGTKYWEYIKHLRLVAVSNQEKRMVTEYSSQFAEFGSDFKSIWTQYVGIVTFAREPFAILGQIGCLIVSIYFFRQGEMSIGQLVIVMGWSSTAFSAMSSIGHMQRRIIRNYVLMSKYFDMLEIVPAVKIIDNPIRPNQFKGHIVLKGVSYSYPEFKGNDVDDPDEEDTGKADEEEKPSALQNVSLEIEPGQVCAFVGHSGSGKSTIVNMLLRGDDPTEGQVLIDGINLRLLDLGHWRSSIGIVEQDPKLWDETLRYNILYGLNGEGETVSEEELLFLGKKTRIDEFFDRLEPKGFDTMIGENGVQLSGGQRQRVAIARAIIRSPSLLILDEATNALDPKNEQLVHEAVREALKGRTGIIIAHRLSTIRNADKIFVFEKGSIVGAGTHADLMKSCQAYQELVIREVGTLSV